MTASGARSLRSFTNGWVIDLGGDYKKQDVGGSGNVFGISTGVAISFWVKRRDHAGKLRLNYLASPPGLGEDKLAWLKSVDLDHGEWVRITERDDALWVDVPTESVAALLQIADRKTKGRGSAAQDCSIFKLFTLGVVTNRDDWVYDSNSDNLIKKVEFLISQYNKQRDIYATRSVTERRSFEFQSDIKWTRHLKRMLVVGKTLKVDASKVKVASFRPFSKRFIYFDNDLNEMQYRNAEAYDDALKGRSICFSSGNRGAFSALATGEISSLDTFLPNACQTLPRYRYTKSGERVDNITDWAVAQFEGRYGSPLPSGSSGRSSPGRPEDSRGLSSPDDEGARSAQPSGKVRVTGGEGSSPSPRSAGAESPSPDGRGKDKDAIFAYCYAVLHDPLYREKYALNLKREFPRIPFYDDFAQWVAWGEALLALHIDYEQQTPFALTRIDTPNPKRATGTHPKPKLKSDPAAGTVTVDEETQLTGIPPEAWTYRLGNRSAIDWVLDQHKEKTPRDPTIAAKFNSYRFADTKEAMIVLLAKVVTVSLETVKITDAMLVVAREKREGAAL